MPASGSSMHKSTTTTSKSSNGNNSAGFITPSAPVLPLSASSHGSSSKHSYSSSSSTNGGYNELTPSSGFVNPTSENGHGAGFVVPGNQAGSGKYHSSSTPGSNAGFVSPSTGFTTSANPNSQDAGFATPSAPILPTNADKYSFSSTTTNNGGNHGGYPVSSGFANTAYGNTHGAGFISPSAPMLSAASGFDSFGGQTGKYATSTTTTTTNGGVPLPMPQAHGYGSGIGYNQAYRNNNANYYQAHGNGNGGGYNQAYSTIAEYNQAYGNNNAGYNQAYGSGGGRGYNQAYSKRSSYTSPTIYSVDKSKKKFSVPIVAPIFIPTSGSAFINGHRSAYHTHYIYRTSSSSRSGGIGRGVEDSAEEREMVGRITAAGVEGTLPIILYEHADRTGRGLILSVGKDQCVDLPRDFNDITSSVNTYGNCFSLCEHEGCLGSCKKFSPGIGDHKFVGDLFNDHVTSVKQC